MFGVFLAVSVGDYAARHDYQLAVGLLVLVLVLVLVLPVLEAKY
ncbi:hypothetical protein [Nostoc flagelliforme]